MQNKIGAKREIRKLVEYLWDNEQVHLMASGTYGPGLGLVVLTDRRLLFVKDGMMSKTTEDFPLEKVASVQWSSGMLMGTLIVFASGNKAEITKMDRKDGKQIADAVRERLASGPAPAATPEPATAAPTGGQERAGAWERLATAPAPGPRRPPVRPNPGLGIPHRDAQPSITVYPAGSGHRRVRRQTVLPPR
jgi:hypothetical protein